MTERHKTMVIAGLMIGMFFSALEQTIVGTAMVTIIGDLKGFSIFAWVTTTYLIAQTIVVPIVGKLSDLYGRRLLYLIGMVIFVLGSILCATASTMTQLIIYRGIQGLGAGAVQPLSQTIIGQIFTAEQRAKWQGVFGALFGVSSVVGPFIGGLILDNSSWHWIFLINAPFGLISVALIFMGMREHESKMDKSSVSVDYGGIVTLVPALVLFLLWISFGGKNFEWNSSSSFLLVGGSIVLFAIFFLIEKKALDPILNLRYFKNRIFLTTNLLGFLLGFSMLGAIMFVPNFMQGVLGLSPTKSGTAMTPMMFSMIISSVIGGRLLLRLSYRTVLLIGMMFTGTSFFLMSTMTAQDSLTSIYVYMVIMGFGMGLVMPTTMIAIQNTFAKEELGAVTSASTFFRSIGGTIGVTVFGAIMNGNIKTYIQENIQDQKDPVLSKMLEKLGTNSDSMFQVLLHPEAVQGKMPPTLFEQVSTIIKNVWTTSFSSLFFSALFFIAAGIIVALFVGNQRMQRTKEEIAK